MAGGPFVDRGHLHAPTRSIVFTTTDPHPDERTELVAACEAGRHRYYRGALVVDNFATTRRHRRCASAR